MQKMFVPLFITALSISGFAIEPDDERMVSVPEDKLDECLGHGLIPAENEEAIQAYMDSLDETEDTGDDEDDEEEAPPPPPKKKALAKKPVKPAAKKATKRS